MANVKKIVPCLDTKNGRLVKGIKFENLRDVGDPAEFGRFYQEEGADELVFLDITATVEKRKIMVNMVKKVADNISIPFTVGGGIASMDDVQAVLNAGADKVSLNTAAVQNPSILKEISKKYRSKKLVCAIDAKRIIVNSLADAKGKTVVKVDDKYCWFDVLTHGGTKSTGMDAIEWAKKVKSLGAGEILPTSKDMDGTKNGYDLELTKRIKEATNLPVTASGGAGTLQHILEAFTIGKADAALAASIFHFKEITIRQAKEFCAKNGVPMKL